jgi:hypothetical protein
MNAVIFYNTRSHFYNGLAETAMHRKIMLCSSKTDSGWEPLPSGGYRAREGRKPFRVLSPGYGRGLKHSLEIQNACAGQESPRPFMADRR